MPQLSFQDFARILNPLWRYYNRMPEEMIQAIWFGELRDMSAEQLQQAVALWIAANHFAPSPRELKAQVDGGAEIAATEEYLAIVEAVARGDRDIALSPQAEKALRAIGGRRVLNVTPPEKLHGYLLREFCRLWGAYQTAIASGAIKIPQRITSRRAEQPKPETDSIELDPDAPPAPRVDPLDALANLNPELADKLRANRAVSRNGKGVTV